MTSGRHSLLLAVAKMLLSLPAERVARVAIDGVDGSGKSTFADELAPFLREAGRVVIRASVDGFHHPRAVRYRRGRDSPEGFYHDSYDYAKLKSLLLSPLGPGGSGRYRPAAFDHQTDSPVQAPEERARPGAILLFDGIFLHRPELRACWDFSIFLEVSFDETFARMARRDGSPADPRAPQNRRYLEGQRLYLRECEPASHATLLIDNNALDRPYILTPTDTNHE